jgi:hypothetical protein
MAGQRPIDRYNAGFRIGSTSDGQRPIDPSDLVIIDDVSEATTTESVRVCTVADLFADMGGGVDGITKSIDVVTTLGVYSLSFTRGILTSFSSENGTGTIDDPFKVYSIATLNNVRNNLAAYYVQTADIDLTGVEWVPIGTDTGLAFTGEYDGNGYTISNLTVIFDTAQYSGLFGLASYATLKNITITDADISGYMSGITAEGILAGRLYSCTVTDCHVDGFLESNTDGSGNVGGLAGMVHNSDISGCRSTGSIEANNAATNVGGLVGQVANMPAQKVSNCYSQTDCSVSAAATAGGLIGTTGAPAFTIEYCYAANVVSGATKVGGLVAKHTGFAKTYTDCFWDVTVSTLITSDGGTGKTTAQMQTQGTFTNWDFTSTWEIASSAYPNLQSEL